ncbi:alkylation response protein AidB-like acyl-CoA dehydrogenase [Deinobacterium chartae]|uniref:Alkylation response protein AidB-like acyl-CoA dehydrogenase n=1 Tax=Deinobacterium chartae TaxID=521158 RepID=A0A841HU47_9DEIO|nr:acyl-CoA dehydrogenase family protein [Deinobacterium chartae]MBB6096877.1 alkylation response protein AidB-like acyl-CoA dehydrogenase [Deinobacterium chartae]
MTTSPGYDDFLTAHLERRQPQMLRYRADLEDFARWVAGDVDAQANYTDRYAPPQLQTYDRRGETVNHIVFNPWYEEQHREVYRRGILARPYLEGAPHLLSFTMGYLLAQSDISLHCPVTLSGAVAWVLAHHVPQELRERYLPELIRTDGLARSGGTWATELHGGSDVGGSTTEARPDGEAFALHGLKWFASNANSGLALATARPSGAEPGWRGLGLYLVPSHLEDGSPNRYRVRRLKDKLGTKGVPTGEIELLGAQAIEVAPPPEGFRLMMEALEYSRVHNAVGSVGVQRRALTEALGWARERVAFGRTLRHYPMVQAQLAGLRVRFEASALLAFESALALDEVRTDPSRRTWLRLVTALAKYHTAEDAVRAARESLELIGGNGYTSDWPIARVLRDAQVLTVWEGPANIQALELLRLLTPRYGGAAAYEQRVREILEGVPATLEPLRAALGARLAGDRAAFEITTRSDADGARYARRLLHRLSASLGFALMVEAAAQAQLRGDARPVYTAARYLEEIDPPAVGAENAQAEAEVIGMMFAEEAARAR